MYNRVSKAVNWIRHLADDGVFCQKGGISGHERDDQEQESKTEPRLEQQSQFENTIFHTPGLHAMF